MDVIAAKYQRGNNVAVKDALASGPFESATRTETQYEHQALQSTGPRLHSGPMQMKFALFGALLGLLLAAPNSSYAQEDTVQAWKKLLVEQVASRRFYPPEANGELGTARVLFVMDRAGNLVSTALVESTGSQALDTAALTIVERAAPFPEPPPEIKERSLGLIVPINFQAQLLPPSSDPESLDTSLERQTKESEKPPRPDKSDARLEDASQAWKKLLVERVVRRRFYPPGTNGEQGTARVSFVMDRAGNLVSRALVESTGSRVLDAAALRIIERAAPFPKPPPEITGDRLRLIAPIMFEAQRLPPSPDRPRRAKNRLGRTRATPG